MTRERRSVLQTRGLIVGYAGKPVAAVPDLDLTGGVVWRVAGSNGAGKTALLQTLGGLLSPIAGSVTRGCEIGAGGAIYVHSVPYLFAGSVRRNLMLARPDRQELHAVANAFGLLPQLDRDAATLSHGEQRRLALARALVAGPTLLLVDEPEGGLDDEAIGAWRAFAQRAVEAAEPVLVVAAHRPLAFEGLPVREIQLMAAGATEQEQHFLLQRRVR